MGDAEGRQAVKPHCVDDHVPCTVSDLTGAKCFPVYLQLFCAICPERCQIWLAGERRLTDPPGLRCTTQDTDPPEIPTHRKRRPDHETRRRDHQTLQA